MKVRRTDASLPVQFVVGLQNFIDVMYYRFEFARGDVGVGVDCTTSDVFMADCGGWGGKPILFKRIFSRMQFLPDKNRTTTYLDDLKQDLMKAGRLRDEAVKFLKRYVESNQAPLTRTDPCLFARQQEPYFPKAKNLADKTNVHDYCYQLFELQDYLINEIGITPGSLLPVWVLSESTDENAVPIMSFLVVKKKLIEALLQYLVWEYGGWVNERCGKGKATYYARKRQRNNDQTLGEALKWGRMAIYRHIQESDMQNQTGRLLPAIRGMKKEDRIKLKNTLKEFENDIALTHTEEIIRKKEMYGEYESMIGKINPEQIHKTKITDANDPSTRQDFRRGVEYGEELYCGGYKNLW